MAQAGEIVARLKLKADDFKRGMQEATNELNEFSNTTRSVARGAAAAFAGIAVAAAGVGLAAAKMASDQEDALAKMKAATGSTKAEMEEFKDVADNLFGKGRGNYDQIYSTLTQVKQVLGQTGKEAENTADKALILSKAFDWDVTESIRAADSAQKAWGASSGESFDMFTTLAQQAGDKSGDLLDTFNEYSPSLADAGISMDTFGNALAAGMDAGAYNFDKIGDALKEFNVRLTDGSAQTHEFTNEMFGSKKAADEFFNGIADGSIKGDDALQTIGDKLSEIEDPIKRNQLGVAYFGTMWEDLGGDVVLAMADAEGALKNVEGATAKAGEALDQSFGAKMLRIRNEFLLLVKDMGEKIMPSMHMLADWFLANMPLIQSVVGGAFSVIAAIINGTIKSFIGLSDFLIQNKNLFAALAAIITAVVLPSLVGFILNAAIVKGTALLGLITSTAKLIATNYMLGLSYLAANWYLLLIVAGIAAVVAGIVLFTQYGDIMIAKLSEMGFNMTNLQNIIEGVRSKISELWAAFTNSEVFEVISNIIGTLVQKFVDLYNAIKNAINSGDFTPLFEAVGFLIPTIIGILVGGLPALLLSGAMLISHIANGMGLTVPELLTKISEIIVSMINKFVELFPVILNTGVQILTQIINGILSNLPAIIGAITQVIQTLTSTISILLPVIIEAGVKILMMLIAGILQILPQLVKTATQLITTIVGMLISLLPLIIESGIKILMALIDGILQILPQLISAAIDLIMAIVATLSDNLPQILRAGIQILLALIDGIVQIIPQLISAAIDLVIAIVGALIDNLPMILEAGVELILALIDGVLSMIGAVGEAAWDIATTIFDKISDIDLVEVGKDIISGLWNGISSMGSWIGNKISGFTGNVLGGIKDFFGIHSPSRVLRDEVGVQLMRGLQIGIDNMSNLPVKAITGVAENVLSGASKVRGAFEDIGNMQVAAPQIGNLAFGSVNVDSAFGYAEGNGGSGTNYNAPIVQVENMNVRNDQDVRQVSKELFNLQRNHDRAKGGR